MKQASSQAQMVFSTSLDLGSGPEPRNPFNASEVFGIDIASFGEKVYQADLVSEPIPFPDCFFDYCTAHDFLEHIPRTVYLPSRRNPFIEVMSEVYRILKPGGIFLAHTPAVPAEPAFQDPTHLNYITSETYKYFAGELVPLCWRYGFKGEFRLLEQRRDGMYLVWKLQKPENQQETLERIDGFLSGRRDEPSGKQPPLFSRICNVQDLVDLGLAERKTLEPRPARPHPPREYLSYIRKHFELEGDADAGQLPIVSGIYDAISIDDAIVHDWGLVSVRNRGQFATLVCESFTTHKSELRHALARPARSIEMNILGHAEAGFLPIEIDSDRIEQIDEAILVGSQSDSVYGHFILQVLPRLYAASCLKDPTILMYDHNLHYQERLASVLVKRESIRFLSPGTVLAVRKLTLIRDSFALSPAMVRISSPLAASAGRYTADRIAPPTEIQPSGLVKDHSACVKRLYISRRNRANDNRVMVNRTEVEDFVAGLGFTSYDPTSESIDEQIERYRSADVIMADAGSGSHNIMFASDRARFITLAVPRLMNYQIDESIASSAGIRHCVIIGTQEDQVQSSSAYLEKIYYRIDVEMLRQSLVRLGVV